MDGEQSLWKINALAQRIGQDQVKFYPEKAVTHKKLMAGGHSAFCTSHKDL